MKITILILMLLGACATEPSPKESAATSSLCEYNDGVWYGCGETGGGGDGGGGTGGTGGSCDELDCSADWQCQQACLSFNAVCIVVANGASQSGSCWP